MHINKEKKIRTNILKIGSKNLNSENWEVYHPNGTHMFTCGEKKATWYLDRGLAKRMKNGRIKLTFEPKGNGFDGDEIFGKSIRETRCVVSGVENGLQRHHIIPYCYRSNFPEQFKSKNHHDVVLINYKIHSEYELLATQFKDEMANVFGVKTINEINTEYTFKLRENRKENAILLSTILSIFKSYGKITNEAILIKLNIISENSGIPYDVVCKYSYIEFYKLYLLLNDKVIRNEKEFNLKYRKQYDHGYLVVQQLDTDEKIIEFVKTWRNHFIDTMKPKFMPEGWSIDFRIKTNI